jgi:hypothetical protein
MNQPHEDGKRILLDEMLPRTLRREFGTQHRVTTVASEGWAGIKNVELLRRVEAAGIDVFVTADRKIEFQQRLEGRGFGVIVVAAGGTKLEDLRPLAPALRDAVERVAAGEVLHVTGRTD